MWRLVDYGLSSKIKHMNRQRIGIYSGTFNPVHSGHLAFALQAIQTAELDKIYFMPERRPRHKQHVEHYGHRVAMIRRALKPHPKLEVLETDDVSFTVNRTHHRLGERFKDAQLVYLIGSDVARHIGTWDNSPKLLLTSELVIGIRASDTIGSVQSCIATLPIAYNRVHVLDSSAAHVSSKAVRQGLREHRYVAGLLSSVAHYSNNNWLYVSLST
jgi:nicotinate-nucleotide adenylyltransferase